MWQEMSDDTISDVVGEYSWFQRSNKFLAFFFFSFLFFHEWKIDSILWIFNFRHYIFVLHFFSLFFFFLFPFRCGMGRHRTTYSWAIRVSAQKKLVRAEFELIYKFVNLIESSSSLFANMLAMTTLSIFTSLKWVFMNVTRIINYWAFHEYVRVRARIIHTSRTRAKIKVHIFYKSWARA